MRLRGCSERRGRNAKAAENGLTSLAIRILRERLAAIPPPSRTRFGSPPLHIAEPGAESSPGKRKGRSARSSAGGAGGGNPRNFTRKRRCGGRARRSEEHTSELQSLMRNSYAVFCLKKNNRRQS